jgi:HK97 family phage portal protein
MIVRTRGGQNMEVRAAPDPFWPSLPPPAYNGMRATATGNYMSADVATGLPVVFQAIRLVGELIATLPVRVYRGYHATRKEQPNTWQWKLLVDHPNDEQSAFDFWYDVAACVESWGNAYILKIKLTAAAVDAIYVLDPCKVVVWRDKGEKVFRLWTGSEHIDLTSSEILHIRGPVLKGGDMGLSPVAVCRDALGAAIDRQQYEGFFYRHNASPGGALKFAERMDRAKARDVVRIWAETHGGPANAGLPAVLTGGAEWQPIGVPLREAQFIEANDFTVADVARMFNLPASVLNHGGNPSTEEEARRLLNFSLTPRLRRISEAVKADYDLFGSGQIYPRHYTDEFIMADAKSMSEVRHNYVQDGVLLVDEVRAELGYPPLPNGAGQVPQITPVGGAPNPNSPPPADGSNNGDGAAQQNVRPGDAELEIRERALSYAFRKFNPNQPRDDHGRWGSGTTMADTLAHVDKEGLNDWPSKGAEAKRILGSAKDTESLYTVGGKYTKERKPVHDAIVSKSFADPAAEVLGGADPIVAKLRRGELLSDDEKAKVREANKNARGGARPRALFMAGGPASGKTSALRADPSVVPPAAVTINPDDVKEQLPEYQDMVKARDKYAATGVHEESSAIAKRQQTEAIDLGFNLIVDGTGDSGPGKFVGKLKAADKAGYDVNAVYVTAPTDVAVVRAMDRAFKSGRWVPEPEIRSQHKNVSANFKDVSNLKFIKSINVYDNGGATPVRIASGSGGNVDVKNDALYASFLMKADEQVTRDVDALDREFRGRSTDIPVNEWVVDRVFDSSEYLDADVPEYEESTTSTEQTQ